MSLNQNNEVKIHSGWCTYLLQYIHNENQVTNVDQLVLSKTDLTYFLSCWRINMETIAEAVGI